MNKEDKIWLEGIYPYFRILKKINELLIQLKNDNIEIEAIEDDFLELSSEMLRLLPYKLDYDEGTICGIDVIGENGILLLDKYFGFIKINYDKITKEYFTELSQIIIIRNKYIHEPHNIKCVCFTFGKNDSYACFKYKNKSFSINTNKLTNIIKDINDVFQKIKIKFLNEIEKLESKDKDHPYIINIITNYFDNYNSNLE